MLVVLNTAKCQQTIVRRAPFPVGNTESQLLGMSSVPTGKIVISKAQKEE